MKEVTMCCTTCPSGCALKVMIDNNEVVSVEGNNCPRGEKFAHKEWINPERMLTSTVYAVINGKELLIPVKSKEPIPRKIMTEAMKEIQEIEVNAPVKMGDVIKENLAGSGVELVACKTVKQEFAAGKRDSPQRESNPYICDFSRGGLNVRFKRSHPNLAPRPQKQGLDSLRGLCFGCRRKIAIYCWSDLGNRQKVLAFCGVVF